MDRTGEDGKGSDRKGAAGPERNGAERIGTERNGQERPERSGEEGSGEGRRGKERSGRSGGERRGMEWTGLERSGMEQIKLSAISWDKLLQLVTKPDGKHKSGGYQARKRKWLSSINKFDRTITLDEDDFTWIIRQMKNRDGGGWQRKIYNIFFAQHPRFGQLEKATMKAHLPKTLKLRVIKEDLKDAVCGAPRGCPIAYAIARSIPETYGKGRLSYWKVNPNRITITFDQKIHHYTVSDNALKIIAQNDDGTLSLGADKTITLDLVHTEKAHVDLSPERKAGIRDSEARRAAAGNLKKYGRGIRQTSARRAGVELKSLHRLQSGV